MATGFKSGGRSKGTLNKATVEIKALAQEYGPATIARLARLAGLTDQPPSDSEQTQLGAMKELLDRGFGKPSQEITGADGGPLLHTYVIRAPTAVESVSEWLRLHAPSDSRSKQLTTDT